MPPIRTVVFDVGGVLIDWNPRYLYRTIIPEEQEMERFLTEVCTPEWHAQHDLGVSYEDTIPALVAAHPEWAGEIVAWSDRFVEMYGGVFNGTVDLLRELHRRRVPLVASTNWGAESWAWPRAGTSFSNASTGRWSQEKSESPSRMQPSLSCSSGLLASSRSGLSISRTTSPTSEPLRTKDSLPISSCHRRPWRRTSIVIA